jgi:hypothetical protein
MNTAKDKYNGWANYETWNVALWIGNDEGLYDMAKSCKRGLNPYNHFVSDLKEIAYEAEPKSIYYQTPDGVAWNDSGLDIEALNEMIKEL